LSRIEKQIFIRTGLIEIIVPSSVEVLDKQPFAEWKSLSSITFESASILSRIECQASYETGLVEIIILASVEVLGVSCFSKCSSLSSVTFESEPSLSRIENLAFEGIGSIEIAHFNFYSYSPLQLILSSVLINDIPPSRGSLFREGIA
jgi:hypothetical protein